MAILFKLIVAHDSNLGIGINNSIPWRLSEDMMYFKEKTSFTHHSDKQNIVIMGRKTWESLPSSFKPLPNRINFVITSQQEYQAHGARVVHSIDQALNLANDCVKRNEAESVFCIGGGQLYSAMIAHQQCSGILVTRVFSNFECDSFFPKYDHLFCQQKGTNKQIAKSGLEFEFQEWELKKEF